MYEHRPELAYATDTLVSVLDHAPELLDARVLIMECTFLDDRKPVAHARAGCHVHLDEVIERANKTSFGLGSGLWTKDVTKAHQLARGIRAGSVWINFPLVVVSSFLRRWVIYTRRYCDWPSAFGPHTARNSCACMTTLPA